MKKLILGFVVLTSLSSYAVTRRGALEKGEYQVVCRSSQAGLNSVLTDADAFTTVSGSHGVYRTITITKPFKVISMSEMEYDSRNNSGGYCLLIQKI